MQQQVARLVGVADADQEQRHVGAGRVPGRLGQPVALGGDAVGQHDDRPQRPAAEVVQHGFHRPAEFAGFTQRPKVADCLDRGLRLGRVDHLDEPHGPRRALVDVNLDLPLFQKLVEPIGVCPRDQGLDEVQSVGRLQLGE